MSQQPTTDVSPDLKELGRAFVAGLDKAIGSNLHAALFYGAAVFPETLPTGDVDFHVILNQALSDKERRAVEKLHEKLAVDFPTLGEEMDGYYILLADTRRNKPPQSQMWQRATDNAWALHCAHVRAGRCLVLYGPDPHTIYPEPTWSDLEAALDDELAYIERHLDKYPAYCILNLCRLMYSYQSQDVVVSKAWSADWAWERYPQWRNHIDAARRSYAHQATAIDVEQMASETRAFYDFACHRIERYRPENGT